MDINKSEVLVVGAGIAGLTSAAILSKLGVSVTLLESHTQSGGCAGTFNRKGYIFDVGATQVAGFEEDGIHSKIFNFLDISKPEATILDPSCVVDLNDGNDPIRIWHDQKKWINEREKQFPGSRRFWEICSFIHTSNWQFANENPVLPVVSFWDFKQFFQAIKPRNLITGILIKSTIYDLLRICGSHKDERLIKFLNLQLKLYSQKSVFRTAALYGCTVLQMSQHPHGLWHLKGSMQALSKALEDSIKRTKVKTLFGTKVESLEFDSKNNFWRVIASGKNLITHFSAENIVFTAPPQSLLQLLKGIPRNNQTYINRLKSLPQPSGALVFYSAIKKKDLCDVGSRHYQFLDAELGSLFVSLSEDCDGRAPKGEITLIASIFTETKEWFDLDKKEYLLRKKEFLQKISTAIEVQFKISPDKWLHRELATPVGFQKWTLRPKGIVGGLGQTPDSFGLFGLSSRTPFRGLWLCGDSIYPGEGTAGVSQSALMVVRQIMASKGINNFNI